MMNTILDENILPERPVIKINWSEHPDPRLADGSELTLLQANEILRELDEKSISEDRYYKISFTMTYTLDGVTNTYEGRYDIGDGDGSLIDHISLEADDYVEAYSNRQDISFLQMREIEDEVVSRWEYTNNTLIPYLQMHETLEALETTAFVMRSRLFYAVDNPEVVMFRKKDRIPYTKDELITSRDYYNDLMIYIKESIQALNAGRDVSQIKLSPPDNLITQSNEVSSAIVNLELAKQIDEFFWNNDRNNYENMLNENRMDRFDYIIKIQLDLDRGNHYKYIQDLEKVNYAITERNELLASLKSEQMNYIDKQEKLLSSISDIEYDDTGRLHFFIKAFDGYELDGTYIIKDLYSDEDVKRLDSIYQGNLHQEITTYWNKIEQRLTEYVEKEIDIDGHKCYVLDRWINKEGVSFIIGYDIEDPQWYYGQVEFDGKKTDFTFDDHRPHRELFEQVYNEYDDNINIQAVMFQNEDADKVISEITRLREQMLIDYPEYGISMDHLSEEIIHAAFASNDKEMLDNIYNTLEEIEHYLFENIGLTTDNDITDMVIFSQADLDSFRKKYLGNELVNGRIEIDEKNDLTEVQQGEEEVSDQVDTNSPAPSDKQLNYANKIAQALNIDLPKARTKTAYQKFISENQERFSLVSFNRVHFTDEQIERANNVDIMSYARLAGLELKREGRDYKATNYSGGLTLTPEKNNWHLFSEDKGGGVVQLCMLLENKTWQEAISSLINEDMQPMQHIHVSEEESTKEFVLPDRNDTTKHVYAYLTKSRGIEPDIVKEMLDGGYIYENTHAACVFVGKDMQGVPRHASVRSTNTEGRVYKRDVPGSQKKYSFSITGNTDTLYVFEAPVDLLSYMSFQKLADIDTDASYIALGGVSDRALERYLGDNPNIKKIVVCTDGDEAGEKGYNRISEKYRESYDIVRHRPQGKDFNEDLVAYRSAPEKVKSQELFRVLGLPLSQSVNNLNFNKVIHPSNNIVKKNQPNQKYADLVNKHKDFITQKHAARIPLVINAFGGPGAGKSVSCMDICQQLKKHGYNAEYVQEYAKELVYDGNMELLDGSAAHQFDMLKEQLARMDRLYGNVDFIVTDSPLLLNGVYNKELTPEYDNMIADLQSHFVNFTYFVERDEKNFQQEGRIHNLEQSKKIDAEVKQLLKDKGIYFGTYSHETINKIVSNSIVTFNRINNIVEPATEKQINFAKEIALKLSVNLPEDNSKASYRAFISEYQEAYHSETHEFMYEAINEKSFAEQVDDVLAGKMPFYSAVKVCDTPEILIKVGCEQLPMLLTQKHLKDAIAKKDNNNIHKHGLTREQILRIPQLLSEPVVVYDSLSRNDSIIAVTSDFDVDNMPIVAAIRPNGMGRYELETIDSNFIMSYHGRNNFINQLISSAQNDKLLYINKIKIQEMFERWGLQLPELTKSLVFDTIIHPSNNIVNKKQQNSDAIFNTNTVLEISTETPATYEEYLADISKGERDVRKLLKTAPKEYLTDELYMVAIESWGALIKEVPVERMSEAMCIAAVKQYGMNLKSIPEDMRTENVCMEAYISSNGRSQRYTPKDIKDNVKQKASELLEKSNMAFPEAKETVDVSDIREKGERWLNEINKKLVEFEQDPVAMSELAEWAGRFYNYSVHNIQLLRNQNRGISYVASATSFEKMGYHIKTDEHAMIARVPLFGHYVLDDNGERIYSQNYTADIKKSIKEGKLKEQKVLRGFQFVSAFYDISQTDCPESDYPEILNMGIPSELHGRAFDAMKDFAESLGFKVMVTDMKSITLRGLCDADNKIIKINNRLQQTMALSTLCHEIAHGILHTSENSSKMTTAQKECEADVMDIMLESSLGLPISDARRNHLKHSYDDYKLEQAQKDRPYEVTLQKLIDRVQTKLFRPHIDSINNYLAQYMPNKMEIMAKRLISNYALLDAVYGYEHDNIITTYPDIFDEDKNEDYKKLYKKNIEESKLQNSFLPKIGVICPDKSGGHELVAVYLSSEDKLKDIFKSNESFKAVADSLSIMQGMILAYKHDVMLDSELYLVTSDGYKKLGIKDINIEQIENKIAAGLNVRKEYECIKEIYEMTGNIPDDMKYRYKQLSKQLNIDKDLSSTHMHMERLQLAVDGLSPGESELIMEYVFRTGNITRAEEYARNWKVDTARDILNEMHIIDVYKYVLWTIETYENTHGVSKDIRLTTGTYNDAAIPSLSDNVSGVIQIWKAYERILQYASDNKYYSIDKDDNGYKIAYVELRDYVPQLAYLPDVYDSYQEAKRFIEREIADDNTSIIEDSSRLIELESKTALHLSADYLIYEKIIAEASNDEKNEDIISILKKSFESKAELDNIDNSIIERLREAEASPERLCYIDYREDAIALFISDAAGNIYERIYEKETALNAIAKVDASDYKLCTDYEEFLARTNNNRYHLRTLGSARDNDLYVEISNSDNILENGAVYSIHDFVGKMSDLQAESKTGTIEYRLHMKNDKGRYDVIICDAELQNKEPVFVQLYTKFMERGDTERTYIDNMCKGIVEQYCNDIIAGLDNDIIKLYIVGDSKNKDIDDINADNVSDMLSAALDYKVELNDYIRSLDVTPADAELMKLDPGIINKKTIQDTKTVKSDISLNKSVKQENNMNVV